MVTGQNGTFCNDVSFVASVAPQGMSRNSMADWKKEAALGRRQNRNGSVTSRETKQIKTAYGPTYENSLSLKYDLLIWLMFGCSFSTNKASLCEQSRVLWGALQQRQATGYLPLSLQMPGQSQYVLPVESSRYDLFFSIFYGFLFGCGSKPKIPF